MAQTPFVIVLILSYNGKHLLEESISSYLANDYQNYKIIVIDNGSTDATKTWVEKNYREVLVLRTEKNLGYSGGFNLGLDYAFNIKKADYVLITNNDVKVDKRVISELVAVASADEKIGFTTGKVYYFDQPDTLQTVGKMESSILWNGEHIGAKEKDIGQHDQIAERVFIDDIYTLVSKNIYEKVGSYDPEFFLQCEEWDWQARAKQKGFKCYYTYKAKIWHKESMTIGKWGPIKAYYDARNPGIVIMKYRNPEFFRQYFWNHTRNFLFKLGIKNLINGNLKIFSAIVRGYFSMIKWGILNNKLSIKHIL